MALSDLNITYTGPEDQYLFNNLEPAWFFMSASFDDGRIILIDNILSFTYNVFEV